MIVTRYAISFKPFQKNILRQDGSLVWRISVVVEGEISKTADVLSGTRPDSGDGVLQDGFTMLL
jgi:hypothetical protein